MASHAILAPSAAHRWLVCTPSARLEAKFPDSESEYAAEGTFAHKWAELQLQNFLTPNRKYKREMEAEKQSEAGKRYWSHGLEEYVDEYVSVVSNKFLEAQKRDSAATLLLEQQLDMSAHDDRSPRRGRRSSACPAGNFGYTYDRSQPYCFLHYKKNARRLQSKQAPCAHFVISFLPRHIRVQRPQSLTGSVDGAADQDQSVRR